MTDQTSEHVLSKYKYELLFGAWLVVTGGTFLRISKQPYSTRLKVEQYESIFKGTSLSAFSLWNPLYALAPLVLFSISLPLAGLAILTTCGAISLLFCRAAIVYVELTVALIGSWISPPSTTPLPTRHTPATLSPKVTSPHHYHDRRRNHASSASLETAVPSTTQLRLSNNSASFATLLGTSEKTRDFEGVGGWRAPGDDDEEALWMGMNSRLQLPADNVPRRHHRSLTGGASPSQRRSWGSETMRMSPVQSRARTPLSLVVGEGEDYFPPQLLTGVRPSSSASEPAKRHRRKSSSSSSRTSVVAMTAKEAGD
ncbi:hypothetical protein CC86DRAFT_397556 [Ophiobolus disseminans]|uniref:Transmembrane protein n=1 Tax=Ophiobolus disseminans TaxID=1469910 RepID=A0A6A6ZLE7_9PLEO|nr:hypothetical protein CC86DRAFT_397556 [Ophiobolus disseminans]